MTTYEYLCLACEHPFEERRSMTAGSVGTALACPSCGSDRVRRRFSFSAATGSAGAATSEPAAGGCCGGGCGCGS
ncbi:MAG: zinc ribbon domain-containing protein [Actinomycetota bacterium]